MVIKTFHWVDYDTPGRRQTRAICGQSVDRYREHSETPNCSDCVRILTLRRHQDRQTAEDVFGATAPGTPVHSTFPTPTFRSKGDR